MSLHHYILTVAALEEEKKAAQIEREALLANYQQHLQIEQEQLERKKEVSFFSDKKCLEPMTTWYL